MSRSILIVEDDQTIGAALTRLLTASGFVARWSTTGSDAIAQVERQLPDLVLLDIGLPDIDGFTVCRWLRTQDSLLPIVMLTARDSDIDIVVGLDAGANDYVTKPFSSPVLVARVRAHLRNSSAVDPDVSLVFGSMRIEPGAHRVFLDDGEVDLRPKEYELLLVLARQAGRVVTRERLFSEVWDLHWESSTKTLDMHVHAVRRKLGDQPDAPTWITTIRGVGYRFELQPAVATCADD